MLGTFGSWACPSSAPWFNEWLRVSVIHIFALPALKARPHSWLTACAGMGMYGASDGE